MISSIRAVILGIVVVVCFPASAHAGMPSITLTDVARLRLQTISFFLLALLLASGCVQLLWNFLCRDFSSLPRLSYRKALGGVILWGLLFILVLTMISGARELMTPGAWEKRGWTYQLADERTPALPPLEREAERRDALDRLRIALWDYSQTHQGRFPFDKTNAGIKKELWRVPGSPSAHYFYVGGIASTTDHLPLVYEPDTIGNQRLVLWTDGSIQTMTIDEILSALPKEGRR